MALRHCFLSFFSGEPSGGWLMGLKFRVKVIFYLINQTLRSRILTKLS